MAKLRAVDYVTKDYEGFRQLMLDLIPQYAPEWTDTSQSDFGVVLIELLANGLDILSYYQDKYFNESFLATAKTRKAVINLCKMLGYELAHQTPAIHRIEFTKDESFIDDTIIIPKGTKIGTDPKVGAQVVFELLEGDVILPAGVTTAMALATHGITVTDNILGTSDGTEFQTFKLMYPDVLKDTLQVVTIENGREVAWERVEDFLSSEHEDRHYTISNNEANEMFVQFGNGLSGRIPTKNTVIKAHYRVGGGTIGNVGLNTINSFVDKEYAGVTFKNIELYIRGEDVEDIEHAKLVAPRHFRNAGRAVTKLDFEDIVMEIEGVSKAKCIETFNENGDLHIYVVPTDFGTLTEGLEKKILDKLNKVKLVHDNPILFSTDYTEFTIDLQVITYSNYINSDVTNRVKEALLNYFDVRKMEFGEDIFISAIIGEVMKVEGVRNVIVNSPLTDIEVPENSVAKLTSVNVVTTGGVEA
jgi:hypothetical protein